jgi:hypothetical protein
MQSVTVRFKLAALMFLPSTLLAGLHESIGSTLIGTASTAITQIGFRFLWVKLWQLFGVSPRIIMCCQVQVSATR